MTADLHTGRVSRGQAERESLPVLFSGVLFRSVPALFLALFYRPVKDVKRRSGCYNERTGLLEKEDGTVCVTVWSKIMI